MSSQPLKQELMGFKKSSRPEGNDNKGFKGSKSNPPSPYRYDDWEGTVKGKTKHTFKKGN